MLFMVLRGTGDSRFRIEPIKYGSTNSVNKRMIQRPNRSNFIYENISMFISSSVTKYQIIQNCGMNIPGFGANPTVNIE